MVESTPQEPAPGSTEEDLPKGQGPDQDAQGTQPEDPWATQPLTLPSSHEVQASREVPRIAGYEVGEEIGRGGMGVVYKARQLGLDRPVALKMIREDAFAGPKDRARFRREAEMVARL